MIKQTPVILMVSDLRLICWFSFHVVRQMALNDSWPAAQLTVVSVESEFALNSSPPTLIRRDLSLTESLSDVYTSFSCDPTSANRVNASIATRPTYIEVSDKHDMTSY